MRMLRLFLLVVLGLATPAAAQPVPQTRAEISQSFAPVVRQTAPAVVNIYTKRVVRTVSPLLNDPFFRRFFGDHQGLGVPQERVQSSLGSGVILRPDGLVVTNHHVVNGADQVTVVLNDRREFEAAVVGSDERTDLAFLRIDPEGEALPFLPMGDSDQLEVGDLVLAIGNPFGVGQTVTSGIVSALARTSVGITDYQSFIQTDAAINPGNSGGALVDLAGRLVGINTAIYSRDGGSNGIGFAIPTPMVKAVMAGIVSQGKAVRGWLGATGQPVTGDMAQALGLRAPRGVLINGIHKNSPAEAAGLKIGDVITAVNGREIDDPAALRFRVATVPVGETAKIQVLRQGIQEQLQARIIQPPELPPTDATEIGGRSPFTGTIVANLNPALIDEIGYNGTDLGVVILRVKRGSLAHRLNLRPGDLVLKVNGRPIGVVDELVTLVKQRADRWEVSVKREGEVLTLVVGG